MQFASLPIFHNYSNKDTANTKYLVKKKWFQMLEFTILSRLATVLLIQCAGQIHRYTEIEIIHTIYYKNYLQKYYQEDHNNNNNNNSTEQHSRVETLYTEITTYCS